MSRKNDNNLGTAAGVAAGIGILAGVGYAAYTYFKTSNNSNKNYQNNSQDVQERPRPSPQRLLLKQGQQSPERLLALPSTEPSTGSLREGEVCMVCKRDLSPNDCFALECSHQYHQNCLLANYILCQHESSYSCPVVNCGYTLSDATIHALTTPQE